MQTLA